MKNIAIIILLAICHFSCNAQTEKPPGGIYKQKGSSIKLELKSDNTYILYNLRSSGHFDIEQCDYSSIGRWKKMSNDVIEITSQDNYQKQAGFNFDLKRENKLSQDSLYITINLPDSLIYYRNGVPVNFSFIFNNNVSKSISSNKTLISLPKGKYLLPITSNSVNRNHIAFTVNAVVSGTTLYKGRIRFAIFEEDIDTEKTNCLTINLPYFDLCFFEFEPYNQELILVKSPNELIWQGKSWEKQR
jgi:hypothetical protein